MPVLFSLSLELSTARATGATPCVTLGLGVDLSTSGAHNAAPPRRATAIPFDQIAKQYFGDGLAVVPTPDGAQLRCVFQRLDGHVTTNGLWLASTKDGVKGEPFRVIVRDVGRASAEPLAHFGKVAVDGQVVRFTRPGLTEEYSVGIDGLRQEFVIERRPAGKGLVRLKLDVEGAKAEAVPDGARLVLAADGRKMLYNRLKVVDARANNLAVKLEVVSAHQLALVLDDAAAEYPVRIDPTFSDANWVSLGGLPGVNGAINAAVVDSDGNLYIGGQFTVAGNVIASNVAEWNGSSWLALGSGMSS